MLLDCGAVQADALTVDRLASLEKVRYKKRGKKKLELLGIF